MFNHMWKVQKLEMKQPLPFKLTNPQAKRREGKGILTALAAICLCLFFTLRTPTQSRAATEPAIGPFTIVNVPEAGAGAYQGTFVESINSLGVVAGN